MQRVTCTVRLAGDAGNTVLKSNVSPAEIAILLNIHGEGSVIDIQPNEMDKVPHAQERERLRMIYGHHVVDRIFPGEFSKLPVTLNDISLGEPPAEDAEDGAAEEVDETEAVVDPAPPAPVLDEDDKILRDSVLSAKSKVDLYQIAKDNDINLKEVPDKMADLQSAILKALMLPE